MADRERAPFGRCPRRPCGHGAPLAIAATGPVLVSGYYGFGNLGDEAVLAGLIAGLRAEDPNLPLVVLSADPAETEMLHGVEAHPRSPRAVWQALAGARLLISGGGSLVQDVTSARSALYYIGTMLAASMRRVPFAVVGQGVGPIRRPWVRRLAAMAFNRAQAISVRDAASARALRAMGVVCPVGVGADLAALLMPCPPQRVEELLARSGLDASVPYLGVVVRPWKGLVEASTVGRAVRRFAGAHGAQVAVFPFDRAHDLEVSDAVAVASGGRVVQATTPQDLLGLVGAMDLMLGVRLHALIFAAIQAVPAVALAYDPKVTAFASAMGLPGPLPADASEQVLEEALAVAWQSRAGARARLRAAVPALRQAAAAGVGSVVRLLAGVPIRGTE
ncbi:MAG: polysaccharide pyruvyl transferase CsaB [bacterium]|nr:polysaccharide pyruvyl transferase CsaB [bacterium]